MLLGYHISLHSYKDLTCSLTRYFDTVITVKLRKPWILELKVFRFASPHPPTPPPPAKEIPLWLHTFLLKVWYLRTPSPNEFPMTFCRGSMEAPIVYCLGKENQSDCSMNKLQTLTVISFVVFSCSSITHLISQNTINIPEIFFGVHSFCSFNVILARLKW